MINRTTTIAMLLAMVTMGGCHVFNPYHRSNSSSFVTLSDRNDDIWIHEAWYNGHNWGGGGQNQYSCASSPLFPPYDNEARFAWRDGNDKLHEQTVKIDPPIPNSFRGRLYFRFQPDGSIKVTPVTWEEWSGLYGGDMSEKEILRWKDRQEKP